MSGPTTASAKHPETHRSLDRHLRSWMFTAHVSHAAALFHYDLWYRSLSLPVRVRPCSSYMDCEGHGKLVAPLAIIDLKPDICLGLRAKRQPGLDNQSNRDQKHTSGTKDALMTGGIEAPSRPFHRATCRQSVAGGIRLHVHGREVT